MLTAERMQSDGLYNIRQRDEEHGPVLPHGDDALHIGDEIVDPDSLAETSGRSSVQSQLRAPIQGVNTHSVAHRPRPPATPLEIGMITTPVHRQRRRLVIRLPLSLGERDLRAARGTPHRRHSVDIPACSGRHDLDGTSIA
jgi:hypothetical protein